MSALDLIDEVIADRTFFKKIGPQLESLPPDQRAAEQLIAAHRDGRTPSWLAAYLLGCIGHSAGYETVLSILLSDNGRGYAGIALVKIDKLRAYTDLRQVIFSDQNGHVRREAGSGLADCQSAEALHDLLTAYDQGRLSRANRVSYHVARCGPTDATILELLRSQDQRKQKLAFGVIECLIAESMRPRPPGKEVASALLDWLQAPSVPLIARRVERLSAWAKSALTNSN